MKISSTTFDRCEEIFDKCQDVFEERRQMYGNNAEVFSKVIFAMFPEGIKLRTEKDLERWTRFGAVVGKLTRYAAQYGQPEGKDSLLDMINYIVMLIELDEEQL